MELDDAELARRLRELLKVRKRSQRAVSKELDVPYRTVQNYLSGEVRIPAVFLLRLCHYLDVETDYLIYQNFELPWPDAYDAMIEALDQNALIPAQSPSGAPKNETARKNMDLRNNASAKMTASFRAAYSRFRHLSLDSAVASNDPLTFGQRPRKGNT
ncbi:MAG: helix-turn-helix transcriptional regulator [Rhodobacteraceae bacterium]|nr:helix-turn-helix transcriptional regulator [Paracoccaceae bacterium]